ncbi:response regulator transcription factor [Silvimonas amylolytica]|uniref:DNA-binding response regulator n=1 Tax=Silvimonas amylolytica TaxID=449663 RepID=A0ABQ2PFT1_9NEIS|nr:response regulator transcription factor [Silvimonas amylolytica]GGP24418.1 DNA-binding response regulator [Silvimonas amylolytica]
MNDLPYRKSSIILADDHPTILLGLTMLISAQPDMAVTGQASDGASLLALLHAELPDMIILDLNMPDKEGLKLIHDIRRKNAHLKILVYTSREERLFAPQAARLGANGFLTKQQSQQVILLTIRSVLLGNYVFPMAGYSNAPDPGTRPGHLANLSQREMLIFMQLVRGKRNRDIAEQLFISDKTVAAHKRNILNKLRLNNIVELVELAKINGIEA